MSYVERHKFIWGGRRKVTTPISFLAPCAKNWKTTNVIYITVYSVYLHIVIQTIDYTALQVVSETAGQYCQGDTAVVDGCDVCALGHTLAEN